MTTAFLDARLSPFGVRAAARRVPARDRTERGTPCGSLATCSVVPMSAERGPGLATGIAAALSPTALCGLLMLLA